MESTDRDENHFSKICQHVEEPVQLADTSGKIEYVNPAWCQMLSYTAREAAQLNVGDVLGPDSLAVYESVVGQLSRDDPVQPIQFHLRAKNHSRIPVRGRVLGHLRESQLTRVSGIFQEVKPEGSKWTELDRLFKLSRDLLCVAGTDGFFRRVNPAFEQVLGYTREELLSRSFLDFVHPEDRQETLAEMERLTEGLPVIDFKNRYQTQDGKCVWLAWRATPLRGTDEIYATARDITKEVELQGLAVRQAEHLSRVNEDLEEFAGTVAHDLKAPLRSVNNVVDWIHQDFSGRLPPEVESHLERLQTQVSQMNALVHALLQFAKGREGAEAQTVGTAELVDQLIQLLSPPDDIEIECDATSMPTFSTARVPLELVLRNLISNAIEHHAPSGGKIWIWCEERGGFYQFHIKDDGPGIPENERSKIFKIFYRPQSNRTDGTGMGLALVRKIVDQFGGEIELISSTGEGCLFRFTWPKEWSPNE